MTRFLTPIAIAICLAWQAPQTPPPAKPGALQLPLKPKSVRFAVIGDMGTGLRPQYEVAASMQKFHDAFPFEFVVMLGDNLYGGETPKDFKKKFEEPYAPLLEGGVKFYASLGNHDNPNERFYKPFNMNGNRYYSFKSGNAEFFALDSTYMDPVQMKWLDDHLAGSSATWKICFFHHPLYSNGKFHGPDLDLRARLEPAFEKYHVNLVLSGHEHVYERIRPQKGIYYFVLGNSGELRPGNLRPSPDTIKGMDTEQTFMSMEISGDELFFQTISRTGATVDWGTLGIQKDQAKSASAQYR